MAKKIIRLCYRKVIDASSSKTWEKYVFDSTYAEFLMQSQYYNQEKKYSSFGELIRNVPDAEKLHFLVSAAMVGYLKQLDGVIPDILNNLGKHFLKFTDYRFEIINSDIKNKASHQVAINFFSESMTWHDTVDNYLLLSILNIEKNEDGILTHLVQLQPFLSIYSLKEEAT
ncbi:MAG TPA: hypothetical protein VJU78_01035 [Chitinophagaceae bacterium]|nr:hypothetical protein [Chitinophagaceae bacterium]